MRLFVKSKTRSTYMEPMRLCLVAQHDALEFPDAEIVLLRHQPVRANR
jgi:hypothetical protein